jgi:ribosome recycling factor
MFSNTARRQWRVDFFSALRYTKQKYFMTPSEQIIKDLESELSGVVSKFKQDVGQVRSNRPSPDMLQDLKVNAYDQVLSIRELGSLSILPPRTIQISLWDKDAMAPAMKAIEDAHMGLSVNSDGLNIRATLSPLGNERREEMMKLVKKISEAARIQIRGKREDTMKRLRDAEKAKAVTEDDVFKSKEKIQKAIDKANGEVEAMVDAKISELGE